MTIAELRDSRVSVVRGDVVLPALVINESALANNLRVMADFTSRHRVRLAPHGKTILAVGLFARQLGAGAWGITTANVVQAHVAELAGAPHVLVANEVVGKAEIEWLAGTLLDGRPTVHVNVDSADGVVRLDEGLASAGAAGRIEVLLEVGHDGGRAGVRTAETTLATVQAVAETRHLSLAGVTTYEGVVGHDRQLATLGQVDDHLAVVRQTTERLVARGAFDHRDRIIVSAGGTRFVDRVVSGLAPDGWGQSQLDLVVRAGSYLTYGYGAGPDDSPFVGPDAPGSLQPALQLWAEVLSLPEPGLAIVGAGKRNVGDRPQDLVATSVVSGPGEPLPASPAMTVISLDDQHAYLRHPPTDLRVGDRIGFSLRYPTSLERWQLVPVTDDDGLIIDAVETSFP
ncbi:MAG: alanine racemase [Candidatus Limnocylindrales bacterium]